MRNSVFMKLGVSMLALGLSSHSASAQFVDWTNTSNLTPWYHVGGNWDGGSAPGSSEMARFNQSATYEVWWDETTAATTTSAGFLQILKGNVTFLNNGGNAQHQYTINGSGGGGAFSDFSISGASTSLTSGGIHLHSLGGGQILDGATLTLDGSDTQGARFTVDGGIGFDVSGNLNINSGATVDNTSGFIGRQSGSTGVATVAGIGSQWNTSSDLVVGFNGTGTLSVEAGGVVSSSRDSYIGGFSDSTSVAIVTGIGSQWNTSSLWVGYTTRGNGTLSVEDGGVISSSTGWISSGSATVTGSGSQWNQSGELSVSYWSGFATLDVEAGGVVNSGIGSIAFSGHSTGVATVTGSGSQWNMAGGLTVGGGQYNDGTLNVEDGGVVTNSYLTSIGLGAFSTGSATVTGAGSMWSISGELAVGNGTLNVEDGGVVTNGAGSIGFDNYDSLAVGVATVTGIGSQWNQSGDLIVGRAINGILNVKAGGVVSNANGYLGYDSDATGVATVSGSGSQWNQSGDLFVGKAGNGTLNVEAGGLVRGVRSNMNSYIGYASGSTGVASVTLDGSRWDTWDLLVGNSGNGTLSVQTGGVVKSMNASIGRFAESTGNANVTGPGSQWNNLANFYVGQEGNGTLNVEAGGMISNSFGYIAWNRGSTGLATVTGPGSQWSNSGNLYVGDLDNGTLNIDAGGMVVAANGYLGKFGDGSGTSTVTGIGSQWNNSDSLYLGGSDTTTGGSGSLNIFDNGLVSVSGRTKLWSGGTITLDGGNLMTGSFDNSELGALNFDDGTLTVNGAAGTFDPGTASFLLDGNIGSANPHLVITNGATSNLSGRLTVGDFLHGNLTVSGGSVVSNTGGYIGFNSGSTGTVTVTSSDSQWNSSSNLYIGYFGNGTLNIESGGVVSNTLSRIAAVSGSTGAVTVTGNGSQWNTLYAAPMVVGSYGNGTLSVENGGVVRNADSYIGFAASSTGMATVTGLGSEWNNSDNLYLGGSDTAAGGTGSLNVFDRGSVNVIGTTKLWSGGTLKLDGGNLITQSYDNSAGGSLALHDGTLTVDGGTFNPGTPSFTINGNTASSMPELALTNSAVGVLINYLSVGDSNQGRLTISEGAQISNTIGYLGRLAGASGSAMVTGGGSQWNNSGELRVGFTGNGDLQVTDGGEVSNTVGYVGRLSGSMGSATVSGAGSQWNNSVSMYVGRAGDGTLNVEAGGLVTNTFGFVGDEAGSIGLVSVSGPGSHWNNSNILTVGGLGGGTLNVLDGGMVSNTQARVGWDVGATGRVMVTGSGSQWNNSSILTLGRLGGGILDVADGGLVGNTEGLIASEAGSTGFATVTGSGSRWINTGYLYVGEFGNGTLRVADGGMVSNTRGRIGSEVGSTSSATVTGASSQWNNSGDLNVGLFGNGTLTLESGGLVSNTNGYIGTETDSVGMATVVGSGSQWNHSDTLFVGFSGEGMLSVEAGGVVNSDIGRIGNESDSTGIATVTGAGSQWNSTKDFTVGSSGNGTLKVEAGGVVSNTQGRIAYASGSTGVATVTGSGSQWNHTSDFFVGRAGNGTLNVESGGLVSNSNGLIGSNAGSLGIATVTGSGSRWNHSAGLFVGNSGNGTLNVADGGLVSNSIGRIGSNAGSTGVATVTGSGSQWNSSSLLYAGRLGHGTLHVESQGAVSSQFGFIGESSGSTGAATITGSGSQWNLRDSLYVGGSSVAAGGTGSLGIFGGGLVSVTKTTKVWDNGSIVLNTGGVLDTQTLDISMGSFEMLNGGVLHADNVLGDLVNTSGVLAPGRSPGMTRIDGSYQQGSSATLEIELAGSTVGLFDQLMVTGDAILDNARLAISAVGSYALELGKQFDIFDVGGSLTGMFAGLEEGGLAGVINGVDLFITYLAGDGNDVALFTTSSITPYELWAIDKGLTTGVNDGLDDDPNGDGNPNIKHFAFDTNPLTGLPGHPGVGGDEGKMRAAVVPIEGGDRNLTLTIPVRAGAVVDGLAGIAPTLTGDGIVYTVFGDEDLVAPHDLIVNELSPALSEGLPVTGSGYEYRTFYLERSIISLPRGFLSLDVQPAP